MKDGYELYQHLIRTTPHIYCTENFWDFSLFKCKLQEMMFPCTVLAELLLSYRLTLFFVSVSENVFLPRC